MLSFQLQQPKGIFSPYLTPHGKGMLDPLPPNLCHLQNWVHQTHKLKNHHPPNFKTIIRRSQWMSDSGVFFRSTDPVLESPILTTFLKWGFFRSSFIRRGEDFWLFIALCLCNFKEKLKELHQVQQPSLEDQGMDYGPLYVLSHKCPNVPNWSPMCGLWLLCLLKPPTCPKL